MTSQNDSPPPLPSPMRRNVVWRGFQIFYQIVFGFWLGYRSRGADKLPREGGAILLINHQSFLDPMLVGLPLRRPVSYLARDSLFRVPLVGWVLRHTYVVPINREAASTASLREIMRRTRHGFLIGIFPEGTRSPTGEVGPLKPGFLAVIRRSDVPIYPVGIAGAYEAMPRGSVFPRPVKVRVVYGDPFTPEEAARLRSREAEESLLELVRARLVECQVAAETWRQS